jgi:hypothetical protein
LFLGHLLNGSVTTPVEFPYGVSSTG